VISLGANVRRRSKASCWRLESGSTGKDAVHDVNGRWSAMVADGRSSRIVGAGERLRRHSGMWGASGRGVADTRAGGTGRYRSLFSADRWSNDRSVIEKQDGRQRR